MFEQAIALDSQYALAHFGLADCYAGRDFIGVLPRENRTTSRSLLETAVNLDPGLADARGVLGFFQGIHDWDWPAADRSCATGLAIHPRSPHILSVYGVVRLLMGRPDEALEMTTRATVIDPLALTSKINLALVHLAGRDCEAVLRPASEMLGLDPNYWFGHLYAGLAKLVSGNVHEAVDAFGRASETSGGLAYAEGHRGGALALAGDNDGARHILLTLAAQGPHQQIPALAVACVHAGLREPDEAFALLDRAGEERDLWLTYMLMADPLFDDLRSDPRYAILVRRIGLTPDS